MYEKSVLILTAVVLATINITAQTNTNGKSSEAIAGVTIPVGEFSKTHIAGINLGYSWSHHRFGYLEALPKKIIGLTADGAIDYYFGRKEKVAGYNYHYGGYLYLRAFGGIIYNPFTKGNISLTTGPTMGIYKSTAAIGFGLKLEGSYYLTNSIAIMPAIIFLKHNNTAALWVVAMQAGYSF